MSQSYRSEMDKKREEKINKILYKVDENGNIDKSSPLLPDYVINYIGQLTSKQSNTRYIYAQRINKFFDYLIESEPKIEREEKKDITTEDLNLLKPKDVKHFIDKVGTRNDNGIKTRANYRSALSSFFDYLAFEEKIDYNVITKIPKETAIRNRQVIYLNNEQEKGFLNKAKNGDEGASNKAKKAHEKVAPRDTLICLVLLRSGLRVSELISLDVGDIDMNKKCFNVVRKRGKWDTVYFDNEVEDALKDYLGIKLLPENKSRYSKTPVFTAEMGKYKGERITVRTVQKIVKKYAEAGADGIGNLITPHKLRATYATNMMQATEDISLVKAQLSHVNIQTTSMYLGDVTREQAKQDARNLLIKSDEDDNK